MSFLSFILLFILKFSLTLCSIGDQTYTFNRCKGFCHFKYCNENEFKQNDRLPNQMLLAIKESNILNTLQYAVLWRCPNECSYVCMWRTVEAFQNDGLKVPQFFGKWPMIRVMGVQEIASSSASFLNLFVTTFMFRRFWLAVPSDSPCYRLWWMQFLSAVFAWASATVFHVADTNVTEKLDYFSAFLLGVCFLHLTIVRTMLLEQPRIRVLSGVLLSLFYIAHVSYLLLVRFDYAYNMAVFLAIGAASVTAWSLWALRHRHLAHHRHILLWAMWLAAFSVLEVRDFAPLLWLVDSHSVWHLATVFITVPLYRFATLDCLHLRHQRLKRSA